VVANEEILTDRVTRFEQLGKKRRRELATEKGKDYLAFRKKEGGGIISEDDNGERQKDWVAGKLEELGIKRREQRLDRQHEEMEEGNMREPDSDQYSESDANSDQYIVLESNLVRYGPGLQILRITPGYDLCQISLRLPSGTTRTAITAMFLQNGLENSDFHILKFAETVGLVDAVILTTIRFGQLLERNKFAFKSHKGTFHVRRDAIWTTRTMKRSYPSLTLTWGSRTKQTTQEAELALASIYDSLFNSHGARMETFCLITPETGSTPDQVMLMVDFDEWDDALEAARNIQAIHPKGIPYLAATTSNSYQWSIVIPLYQYKAQVKQWSGLSDTKHKSQLEIKTIKNDVVIRVLGDDTVSAGALKVRVEKLARGEILEGVYWHPSFAYSEESAEFFRNVIQTAKVHLTCHPDSRTLVAYGECERVDEACKMIKAEVSRREQVTTKTTIPDASDNFFARGGFEKVKELVGEENVDWRITSRWSVIRMKGGEEATHHLRRLIKESLVKTPPGTFQEETMCPVCFTDTPCPEMLECGHGYCSGCLNLFLKAAANNKIFPIVCVGDGATCNSPIALPFIRRFLPQHTFKQLLEAAFSSYLEQNPTQFRYCKTPDCIQTYLQEPIDQATTITCPSCFAKTCSSCSENHGTLSCVQDTEKRWNTALGYKRCPSCAVWVEKWGGCNHMACKCGAHICWLCLGVFAVSDIYRHISTHNGTHG